MISNPSRFCLFGASPNTGNQGVNALCWSTLAGLAQRGCNDLHVFDYGLGTKDSRFGDICFTLHGMTVGKKVWRSNHLGVARLAAFVGLNGHRLVNTVASSDVVLDVSGGDSFTDLYGSARFRNVIAPKEIALHLRRPLVLLPQTYGPFTQPETRRIARQIITKATTAYARDSDSFNRLKQLLGDDFDPAQHRQGVDLAFGLLTRPPAHLDESVASALWDRADSPLIGLNISGLIANRAQSAKARFNLETDYLSLMRQFLVRLLDETDAHILLVPHVHAPAGHIESDLDASNTILNSLPARVRHAARDRITTITSQMDACELKWLIAKCDWFCGTRMHSTIAALSSGVPTAALAYSLKTQGVFDTCGSGTNVIDLRKTPTAEALERLIELWLNRQQAAEALARRLPQVHEKAVRQLDEIISTTTTRRRLTRAA